MKKILLMVALASLCASVSAQKSADRKAARAAHVGGEVLAFVW